MVAKARRRSSLKTRGSPRAPRLGNTSRLTSKYQATVPREVRKRLGLKSGDEVVYEVLSDGTVVVRKSFPLDIPYLKALESTLSEWESEEDNEAYKHL